jgi:hypothetical protein
MGTYEPYSKRKRKAERSGTPVVYQYDQFPDGFRVQAYYALLSVIGHYDAYDRSLRSLSNRIWTKIDEMTRVEHGVIALAPQEPTPERRWRAYLRGLTEPDLILDALEIGFITLIEFASMDTYSRDENLEKARAATQELNRRFREHDIGFEFVTFENGGMVVKVDSQFAHANLVEPIIASLQMAGFRGPLEEFIEAHRKYRHGDNKGAVTDAHKAFESTLKAIFTARGWEYDPNSNASKLIPIAFSSGLIPSSLESYFGGINSIFSSGVPTLRNRMSGHGQGSDIVELPDHFAAFAIHLAASNIEFLMSCYKDLPPLQRHQTAASTS